tara:strand:- start:1333 stop:2193 length:861 start_codon:yes stop_codon:yes gene_type:complete
MSDRSEIGVPAGAQMIEADGVRLAVAREGSGPTVVCLHAIGHGGGDFDAFATAVRGQFDVIRIDWPGQGRSAPDHQPASAARYATLLAEVLRKLDVRQPIIIGNSIGGAAAILYASRNPVRSLVLCDTGGLVKVGFAVRLMCGLFVRFFAGGARGAWWYPAMFALYYRRLVLPSPAAATQRKRIIAASRELAPLWRDAWNSFRQKEADLRGVAAALDIPVWVAWAKGDRVIPLALCTPAFEAMKHARITVFTGGHAAFLEQPDAFAEAFLGFAGAERAPVKLVANV